MKNRIFMIAIVLSVAFCWPAGWSIENPGIDNPIGPGTVPPSTYINGLINNPTPIDSSGNLLITGNVRRGRHFRGGVPYRSTTTFGSSLGSSSLSSFLRDTAGSEDFQTHSNKYGTQPYYSPTETVTTMMPGRSEIFMPERTTAGVRAQQDTRSEASGVFGLNSMAQEQNLFSRGTTSVNTDVQRPASQYSPLAQSKLMLESRFPTSTSKNQQGIELLTPAQIGARKQGQASSAELFTEQVQDIVGETQSSITLPNPERVGNLWEKDELSKFGNQETNDKGLRPNFEIQTSGQNRDGDQKQSTLVHQGKLALEQFPSSMDSVSQENLFLSKDINRSVSNREFQSAQEQIHKSDQEQSDVLERIKQQLEDLTKSIDAAMQPQGVHTERRDGYKDVSTDSVANHLEMPLTYQLNIPDSGQAGSLERIKSGSNFNYYGPQGPKLRFNGEEPAPTSKGEHSRTDVDLQTSLEFTGIRDYKNSQHRNSPLDELNKLSQAEISAEASRIMGTHNSLESLSQSKFNQHMRDAEEYMKAGRYYRAASCFSLASVYQADNPLAIAGRGHALFAAGEYVSSALFLSRAIENSPEYLRMRVDLAAMFGDERKLADRIADIEQWLARSGSSELQFLLGYVYFRTGQLLKAKQAINAAYKKTPESPAVKVMKITIDNMIRQ